MIIDSHSHIYPDKIASLAVNGIGDFYNIPISGNGTLKNFISLMDKAGIDKAVVHSVATTPHQVESINNFIIKSVQKYPDRLIGYMTLHQDYTEFEKEINRGIEAGLKGVKMHPDFQKFAIDDQKVYPIYECLSKRIPILFHTGDKRYKYSNPHMVKHVLDDFPELDVIGAHFGGWSEWAEATELLKDKRIWVDTSSTTYAMPPEEVKKLINAYGTEKVLFGVDFPMWNPVDELERFNKISISDDAKEKILSGNIINLLKL